MLGIAYHVVCISKYDHATASKKIFIKCLPGVYLIVVFLFFALAFLGLSCLGSSDLSRVDVIDANAPRDVVSSFPVGSSPILAIACVPGTLGGMKLRDWIGSS